MLKARNLTESDYDTLVEWWKKMRFPVPPRDFLPNNGLDGIMIYNDEGDEICAGFIYETSAKSLAWIEYIVSNFDFKDREVRKKAIPLLIQCLVDISNQMGKKYIYTNLKNEHLINHFDKCGFVKGSGGTTEMVRIIS